LPESEYHSGQGTGMAPRSGAKNRLTLETGFGRPRSRITETNSGSQKMVF